MEYSIGQFSKITGMSVKAIRFYQEKGLLRPCRVQANSRYRFYDDAALERARAIRALKELQFPLEAIRDMLKELKDDQQLLPFLEKRKAQLQGQLQALHLAADSVEQMLQNEREAQTMLKNADHQVEEKEVPSLWVASLRWKGSYDQTGEAFGKLYKAAGRWAKGKPFNLYYDEDFKEEADIESCVALAEGANPGSTVTAKELKGGRALCLVHQGPYSTISQSYAKIFEYAKARGLKTTQPSREHYLKGPGMIFKGNPKKYLTEIQLMIKA